MVADKHIACEVLSMSKVIMNEVMCLAEDIDTPNEPCKIYYTDTDSMHINSSGVNALTTAFYNKYGRELEGK